MKLFISISIISFLIFTFCKDEINKPNEDFKIEIIEPGNHFIVGQYKYLVVKLRLGNPSEVSHVFYIDIILQNQTQL